MALGGGRAKFLRATDADPEYPDRRASARTATWPRSGTGRGGAYVFDQKGFDALDPATTGPVLGLFEPSHMQYELDRASDTPASPRSREMTEKAIRILQRGPKGYFLMVEAGRIDHGHHAGNAIARPDRRGRAVPGGRSGRVSWRETTP